MIDVLVEYEGNFLDMLAAKLGGEYELQKNAIKYIIVRKEAAINDGFTVTKLPGLLLRLHHHTSTKQQ